MSKYHQARPTSASKLKVETSRFVVISMVTSTKNSCEELGSCHIDIILIADENAAEKVKNVHLMKIIINNIIKNEFQHPYCVLKFYIFPQFLIVAPLMVFAPSELNQLTLKTGGYLLIMIPQQTGDPSGIYIQIAYTFELKIYTQLFKIGFILVYYAIKPETYAVLVFQLESLIFDIYTLLI
ncbi:Hypothetical_protein [Hexamita inflata]|uniref:Hypothetical_protein n=1 Tax=Hexamita inflata TaxID=28002 RepID=A0ABP1HTK5_9EUKA